MTEEMIRRLMWLAYEQGWSDACKDHLIQRGTREQAGDPMHPIGESRAGSIESLLAELDPNNMAGLR